jgi:hypothetical protein
MPNWTQNEVQIFGDQQKMDIFKKSVESKTRKFDFELIVPFPRVVKNVSSFIEQKNLEEKHKKNMPKEFVKGLLGNDDQKLFPNKCWYEWCIHNWGTKWNACEVSLSEFPEYLEYKFETAWDAPRPVFAALWFLWHLDMKIIWKCRHEDDGYKEEEELNVKAINPILHSSEVSRQAFLQTLPSRIKRGKK